MTDTTRTLLNSYALSSALESFRDSYLAQWVAPTCFCFSDFTVLMSFLRFADQSELYESLFFCRRLDVCDVVVTCQSAPMQTFAISVFSFFAKICHALKMCQSLSAHVCRPSLCVSDDLAGPWSWLQKPSR